jgi:hypothetical protein
MSARKRCPNGTRKNKKTGNCEKKTKKRCPNGTRKNKKTGNCEKKLIYQKNILKKSKISQKSNTMSEYESLNKSDQEYIKNFILENYGNDSRKQEALDAVPKLYYDPEYESVFDGNLFTGPYKERYQAMDKIQAFFKYSDDLY